MKIHHPGNSALLGFLIGVVLWTLIVLSAVAVHLLIIPREAVGQANSRLTISSQPSAAISESLSRALQDRGCEELAERGTVKTYHCPDSFGQ
jgi:hypothetical protein